jgi:hypothetical protein
MKTYFYIILSQINLRNESNFKTIFSTQTKANKNFMFEQEKKE